MRRLITDCSLVQLTARLMRSALGSKIPCEEVNFVVFWYSSPPAVRVTTHEGKRSGQEVSHLSYILVIAFSQFVNCLLTGNALSARNRGIAFPRKSIHKKAPVPGRIGKYSKIVVRRQSRSEELGTRPGNILIPLTRH